MKGQTVSFTPRAAVVVIISLLILGLALNMGETIPDKIRVETISVVEKRIGSALHMTSSVEEAEVQLNFKDDYELRRVEGDIHLHYSADGILIPTLESSATVPIDSVASFSAEEGASENFCIIKSSSQLRLVPEECS